MVATGDGELGFDSGEGAIAYIKVVAVKKLVVGFRGSLSGPPQGEYWSAALPLESPDCSLL